MWGDYTPDPRRNAKQKDETRMPELQKCKLNVLLRIFEK
jgi:hypothetical protein